MYEYFKEMLEKEIDDGIKKYGNECDKKEALENELENIENCQHTRFLVKSNKVELFIFSSLTILLTVLGTIASSITIRMNLFQIIALVTLFKSIQSFSSLKDNKKILKEVKYQEYSALTKDEMKEIEYKLIDKIKLIEKNIETVTAEIRSNENALDYINDYEQKTEFFEEIGLFKTIKTKEELEEMYKKQKIASANSLEDYLNEKVYYSDIHFDSGIGENINYTENSKKLIKKL